MIEISSGIIAVGAVGVFTFGLALGFWLGQRVQRDRELHWPELQAVPPWHRDEARENLLVGDPRFLPDEIDRIEKEITQPSNTRNWWLWPIGLICWALVIFCLTKILE